jgi:uncharacterized membrane protein HdeD (DUF308 family)
MSATSETTLTALQGAIFGDLKRNWGWLLALGIICIILGTIGFYMTFALTLASVQVFGILILAGGVLQLLDAFTCKGWKGVLWHVLIALLYLGAGAVMLYDPLLASKFLTLVIAALLIAVGVARFIIGLQLRPADGWYWPVLSGLISSLLGGMIIAQWPLSGLWVIGLFVAIELVVNGWSYVFVALAARKAGRAEATRASR